MPGYSENDVKAIETIESLMVFDNAGDIQPQAFGRPPGHRFAISYAKADRDQFDNLMSFEGTALQPQPVAWNVSIGADEKSGEPFYTKSDLSLFGRIPLPTESVFASGIGAGRGETGKEPGYNSEDLRVFSDLMQFQPGETKQPMPARRENLERPAVKIVDVDRERAAERQNFWNERVGMKIVFSDAEGRDPRALR